MPTPSTTNLISGIYDIDFEGIKSNLIQFLRANNDFPDAIYTGSAFNTLLDVLAYNTHYNMLYSSFTLNEAFLDSCSKYSSAVSIAKSLGYVPYSTTAAKITLDKISSSASTVIPQGATFTGTYNGNSYSFTNLSAIPLLAADTVNTGRFQSVGPITLYYGSLIEETTAVRSIASTGVYTNVKALISNKTCDLSTLNVRTIDPITGNFQIWNPAGQYTEIGPNDKVYFIRMREDMFYEIYFGDGVIGAVPTNTSSAQDYINISLQYIAVPPNVDQPLSIDPSSVVMSRGSDPSISYVTFVNQTTPFIPGSDLESIDSIKFHAPRNFTAQNRAVTASDYSTLVTQKFPWIESVRVWGGETHNPPRYGAVYLNVKPVGRLYTSQAEKNQITSYLQNGKSMLTITPIVIDPTYTTIVVNSNVTLDASLLSTDIGTVTGLINTAIGSYIDTLYLSNSVFRISELSAAITNSCYGIIANDTNIKLQQAVPVVLGISSQYSLNIENSISTVPGSVTSQKFLLDGSAKWNYISSDASGNLILNTLESNGLVSSSSTIGSIDSINGIISLNSLIINQTESNDSNLTWTITTISRDITPIRDMILTTSNSSNQLNFNIINSSLQNRTN